MEEIPRLQELEKPNEFEKYESAIREVILIVEKEWLNSANQQELSLSNWDKQHKIDGEINGILYEVRTPHLRKGKHAFVAIIDIKDRDENIFSCVIRDKPEDAETYLKNVSEKPIIAEYTPKLYRITDNWVIMEKLSGLELEEVTDKIKADEDFAEKYASNVYTLIEKTAESGLILNDVMFVDGHNCMVDPGTGEIKIIEQRSLNPQSILNTKEIITDKLFSEINQIRNALVRNELDGTDQSIISFMFQVLRKVLASNKSEDLYIKSRAVKPTHPRYKTSWYIQNMEKLSDKEHQNILNNPNLRETYTVNFRGSGYTETFSPEFINAIDNNNLAEFRKLIENRKYKINITDKNDPRYNKEILADAIDD